MKGLFGAFGHEFRQVFTNREVLTVLFGGLLFYAILYPLPYQHNVPVKQALAVLDQDQSQLSRRYQTMLDATPQVEIAAHPRSMDEAKRLFANGDVHGLLVIPPHFERDMQLGKPITLPYAADASYFLIYSTIMEGAVTAGLTLALETQAKRELLSGESPIHVLPELLPMRVNAQPVFNPIEGYVNYVVPAVFVLILHQTLLIVMGLVTVLDKQNRRNKGAGPIPLRYALPSRVFIIVATYLVFAMLYFGFFFRLYDIYRWADPVSLLLVSLLFLTTTAVFAMMIGLLVKRPEHPMVLVLLSSLPIVFTSGFVWPLASLPGWLETLSWAVPAKSGILALVKLNQMDAGLTGILPELKIMAGLLLGYTVTTILLALKLHRNDTPPREPTQTQQDQDPS